MTSTPLDPRASVPSHEILRRLYDEATAAIDGRRLLAQAGPRVPTSGPWVVLALGKVAGPMWEGLWEACAETSVGRRPDHVLIVTTPAAAPSILQPEDVDVEILVGDHPIPSSRSEMAAARARHLVRHVPREGQLTVLLSGGTSALMAEPLPGLGLAAKRRITHDLARAGAPIAELNVVRKQLSRIKGGRLAALAQAPTDLYVLADVVAPDEAALLATVGSGPFAVDGSTFADAQGILSRYGVVVPAQTLAAWKSALAQAPQPVALPQVVSRVIGQPSDLGAAARAAVTRAGYHPGELPTGTESTVTDLAQEIVHRMETALKARGSDETGAPSLLVGYGEPGLALPSGAVGHGGRASHLAWEVARRLEGWPETDRRRVAFLAAATDDRDGNSSAHGAIVDGTTFARARGQGLACEAFGRNFDTASLFAALGDAVVGKGRSNLLDLHLAWIG